MEVPSMTSMNIAKPFNILVQRRAAIGDTIMTTAVVRELKKRYGANAAIDVATDCAEVYRNNPYIRNVFPVNQIPPVNNRYDIYFNLDDAYELNPDNNFIDNMFYRVFGSRDFDQTVELFPDREDIELIENFIQTINCQYVVIHMRNWHWTAKNITMDIWFDVFEKLFTQRTDFKIVCVGGPTDHVIEDHPNFVDARDKFNAQQQKVLCDHARCFVGIDSSPFWFAATSNTHIVSLSTLFEHRQFVPHALDVTAIATREDCAGCYKTLPTPVRQPYCPKATTPCNNNFDTEAIARAILRQLK
jgi:ADP-heptose:LPS heptosyltransferase